jgi:phage gp36-like protein
MASALPDRDECERIEQALVRNVEQARTAYDEAKTAFAKLMEGSTELGLNHPDGRTAQRQANAIRDAATERYAKALRALTDFLLSKRLP